MFQVMEVDNSPGNDENARLELVAARKWPAEAAGNSGNGLPIGGRYASSLHIFKIMSLQQMGLSSGKLLLLIFMMLFRDKIVTEGCSFILCCCSCTIFSCLAKLRKTIHFN